jgi:molecular chaperone GrpE (heat shock protein)
MNTEEQPRHKRQREEDLSAEMRAASEDLFAAWEDERDKILDQKEDRIQEILRDSEQKCRQIDREFEDIMEAARKKHIDTMVDKMASLSDPGRSDVHVKDEKTA